MRRCVPRARPVGRAFVLAMTIALFACGDPAEPSAPVEDATTETVLDENGPPVVEDVVLEPAEPSAGEAVRVVAQVRDPDGDPVKMTYEWTLGGEPVGNGTAKLMLTGASRGDRLQVVVVASDGHAESKPASAEAWLGNHAPTVERIGIGPAFAVTAGEPITVSPEGRDAEGDELTFSYSWQVNGEELDADGPELDTRELEKDDVVRVAVRASDGQSESEPFWSPEIRLTNQPPKVVSKPGASSPDGFAYTVEAVDPDGDAPLRFELERAPAGMEIGAHSGVIQWKPRPDQAGSHQVRVIVDDLQGGRVAHTFEVEVGGAPPASAGR